MGTNDLFLLIDDAIENGINMERLFLATGLDEITFSKYHREMLFSAEQVNAIQRELKEWKG